MEELCQDDEDEKQSEEMVDVINNWRGYIYMSVLASVCLCVCRYVTVSVCLSVCVSVYVYLSVCLSVCVSVYVFCLCICVYMCT